MPPVRPTNLSLLVAMCDRGPERAALPSRIVEQRRFVQWGRPPGLRAPEASEMLLGDHFMDLN